MRLIATVATVLAVIWLAVPAPVAAASITVTPDSGVPGDTVTISGTGYPAWQRVTISWDGTPIPFTNPFANGRGSFSIQRTIHESGTTGEHTITGTSGSVSASTTFTVGVLVQTATPTPTVTPVPPSFTPTTPPATHTSTQMAISSPTMTATPAPSTTATHTPTPTRTAVASPSRTATSTTTPTATATFPPGIPEPAADTFEGQVLWLTNWHRAQHGLSALRWDPALGRAADDYASLMSALNCVGHECGGTNMVERNRSAGYDPWAMMGENVAGGQTSPQRVVDDWMNSPGHRGNILSPDFRDIGIGFAPGNGQSGSWPTLWAQEFGTRFFGPAPTPTPTVIPTGFLRASGGSFTLDGQLFRATGVNVYNAAMQPDIYACGPWMGDPDTELHEYFSYVRNVLDATTVRFWAYQRHTLRPDGTRDWSGIDRVMAYAQQHGIKVIPVLENNWEHCTYGGQKTAEWYRDGYRSPYGAYPLSYRDYVAAFVARYKDHPSVAFWSLMNEAESPDHHALYLFTGAMTTLIKSIDPHHMVTLGLMGSGQAGTANWMYGALQDMPSIDLLTSHDYHREDESLPQHLANNLTDAQAQGKPHIVAEAGMLVCRENPEWQLETVESRAAKFDAKMTAYFGQSHASGYLIWHLNMEPECAWDGSHAIGPGDPMEAVLREHAR